MEKIWNGLIQGLTRKTDFEKWPTHIYFFKGDKWLFRYDLENHYLWCSRDLVWDVLKEVKQSSYNEIKLFIKIQVEQHFKQKELTPETYRDQLGELVEQHFKQKDVTPTPGAQNDLHQITMEQYFKQKDVTPDAGFIFVEELVEQHFKKEVDTSCNDLYSLLPLYTTYENERLSNKDYPALIFPDSEFHFYYRGVYIPHELFFKLKENKVTFEDWANQENEEVKSAILAYIEEVHGGEALYRFISKNLEEIDTYIDKKEEKYLKGTTGGMNIGVYTLFKGKISGVSIDRKREINLSYVRCYCPSTDRMFFLGVNPKYNNAKDAIASLYKCPRKLADRIDYINRQGERFSTVLTNEGKRIRKTMTEKDWADLVTISGDDYFSKMRYEY